MVHTVFLHALYNPRICVSHHFKLIYVNIDIDILLADWDLNWILRVEFRLRVSAFLICIPYSSFPKMFFKFLRCTLRLFPIAKYGSCG